jgi:hypothetical protein
MALLALAGCTSYGDYTSDAFDPDGATQEHFTMDSARCRDKAEVRRSYDIRGIAGTHVERHEIFNRAYVTCMKANGYALRDWSPDIAVPFDIKP